MPAIQPPRLKIQAIRLAEQFGQPAVFVRATHHLFDFYADRTHRPGQAGDPPPLTPAYNVPPQVLRRVALEVAPYARRDPEQGLALSDALWAEPNFECRQLAAIILGLTPIQPSELITSRVREWIKDQENRLVEALLKHGLAYLRHQAEDDFLRLVESWLNSRDWRDLQVGLRALRTLLEEPGYQNLPVVLRMLTPLARSAPSGVRPDLLAVFQAIAQRSPQEAAYFLRQNISAAPIAWLARQTLAVFPPAIQESLKQALRDQW